MMFFKKRVYLDNAATTQIDKSVLNKIFDYDKNFSGNASSIYQEGVEAKKELSLCREKIARKIQGRHEEIFFTSGGTESNNLALIGVFQRYKRENKDGIPKIIISSIEHASVYDTAKYLEKLGAQIEIVDVDSDGFVRPLDIIEKIDENTILVSLMYANNEIGSIQKVGAVGRYVREWREKNKSVYPYFHSDACQAGNYLPVDVPRLRVDLLTVNSSKIYGPKGVAFLYIRKGVKIDPILIGGGQEGEMRSGTENIGSIIGLTESFLQAQSLREKESERLLLLQKYFFTKIKKDFPTFSINGSEIERLPNNINIHIPGFSAEEMVVRLDSFGISVSAKSACSSVDTEGSYVIMAIGKGEKESKESLRITMGRDTTKKDLDFLLQKIDYILQKYQLKN
jgi:cysteine desulfurase